MYLLDTNVLSELRPGKRGASRAVLDWAASMPAQTQFISSLSLLELHVGVIRKARSDRNQGTALAQWMAALEAAFADRVLPFTGKAARLCAAMHVPDSAALADSMIAATALEHGFIVVTRNVQDFARLGVSIFNPWDHAGA